MFAEFAKYQVLPLDASVASQRRWRAIYADLDSTVRLLEGDSLPVRDKWVPREPMRPLALPQDSQTRFVVEKQR